MPLTTTAAQKEAAAAALKSAALEAVEEDADEKEDGDGEEAELPLAAFAAPTTAGTDASFTHSGDASLSRYTHSSTLPSVG